MFGLVLRGGEGMRASLRGGVLDAGGGRRVGGGGEVWA